MAVKRGLPILQKVSNLLRVSIFITKIRKPIIPKLVFLKKSRKLKRFQHLKYYNYGFLEEYQFSPSSTPLIHYRRRQLKNRSRQGVYPIWFLSRCLGRFRAEGDRDGALEVLPAIGAAPQGEHLESWDYVDEDDSIDQRAERFIQMFYEEIRLQKQESFSH